MTRINQTTLYAELTTDGAQVAARDLGSSTIGESDYALVEAIHKHPTTGRLYVIRYGGAQMSKSPPLRAIDHGDAVDWIASHAEDSVTGYGYTREQAEAMLDGRDPGPGYRGR